jgi:hypothetical protein
MSRSFRQLLSAAIALLLLLQQLLADTTSDDQLLDILLEVEETNAWLEALEEEKALLLSALQWQSFLDVQLHIGAGYSDNYLRRRIAVPSRYSHFSSEIFWAGWGSRHQWQAYLFAEGSYYHAAVPATSEAIAIAQLSHRLTAGSISISNTLGAFAGDQIYDASLLLEGLPRQERLRQIRPEWNALITYQPADQHRIEAGAGGRRTAYADSDQDNWRAQAQLRYAFIPSPAHTLSATLQFWQERYDHRQARSNNGSQLGEKLRLNSASLKLDLRSRLFSDRVTVAAYVSGQMEREAMGEYDASDSLRSGLSASAEYSRLRLDSGIDWLSRRYRERTISFFDSRPQRQEYLTAYGKLSWRWTDQMTTSVEVQYEDYSSNVATDQYRQVRTQFSIQWQK